MGLGRGGAVESKAEGKRAAAVRKMRKSLEPLERKLGLRIRALHVSKMETSREQVALGDCSLLKIDVADFEFPVIIGRVFDLLAASAEPRLDYRRALRRPVLRAEKNLAFRVRKLSPRDRRILFSLNRKSPSFDGSCGGRDRLPGSQPCATRCKGQTNRRPPVARPRLRGREIHGAGLCAAQPEGQKGKGASPRLSPVIPSRGRCCRKKLTRSFLSGSTLKT